MSAAAARLSNPFRSRGIALVLAYAIGMVATRMMGDGPSGAALLMVAAPAAIGMLIRLGGRFEPADVLRLIAAHLTIALAFKDPLGVAAWEAARGVVHVACGVMLFQSLRRLGVVRSPISLMGALVAVAVVSPVAALGVEAMQMAVAGGLAWGALATSGVVDLVSTAMILAVTVTQGRGGLPMTAESGYTEEKRPGVWEYASAGGLVLALIWFSLDSGRPETAVAGSVALLWFSLRLGLFPTTVAAFAFAVVHLRFGAADGGLAGLSGGDPVVGEMLRYVSLAVLTAPSIVVATVVFDQQRLKRMFAYRAMHDGLTALVNRTRFMEALETSSRDARAGKTRFLLLAIDLDHFKPVNDLYGHARGDRLLIEVARRLKFSMRSTDIVARVGGDEFAIIAPVPTVEDAIRLAKRLVETVNQDCELDGVTLRPSVTVGGVLAPDSSFEPQHLMLLADQALYKAKAAGRNCWRFATLEDKPTPAQQWREDEGELPGEVVFLD